jgi:hypothetical protein
LSDGGRREFVMYVFNDIDMPMGVAGNETLVYDEVDGFPFGWDPVIGFAHMCNRVGAQKAEGSRCL